MEQTLVFPSNAQPETYSNTASQFQTDLQQPIDLNGSWEVALQDLSYVNTITSLRNESVMLGHTHRKASYIEHLEDATKLVHYDLQKHANEWSEERSRSKRSATYLQRSKLPFGIDITDHVEQDKVKIWKSIHEEYAYMFKLIHLLTLINRLGHQVWSFHYARARQTIYVTMRSELYGHYGFYVSPDLKRILGLKNSLFLPSNKIFPVKGSGAFLLIKDKANKISRSFPKVVRWDLLDLRITLLPIARMKRSVAKIEEGSVTTFVHSVNEPKLFDMAGRPIPKIELYRLRYMNKFGNDNVAFVRMNDAMQKYLSLKKNMFWQKEKFTINASSLKPTQSGCEYHVFHSELTPLPPNPIFWRIKEEVKIPPKHYNNGYNLCAYLNKGDKSQFDYEFEYDAVANTFSVQAKDATVVQITPHLAKMLGFPDHQFLNEKVVGKPTLLNMNLHHFYIYANFIQSSEVGGAVVPLLRYCPIDNANYGQTIYKEFLNKVYIPVNVSRLHHVEFAIYDDTGKPIKFVGGRTVLTCHFRKVK